MKMRKKDHFVCKICKLAYEDEKWAKNVKNGAAGIAVAT